MSNLDGATYAAFTIALSVAGTETIQVEWFTEDGTAKAGTDYEATNGLLTFQPGELSKQVQVLVYGRDPADTQEDRNFHMRVKPPINAILGTSLTDVVITILDSEGTAIAALIVPAGPKGGKGDTGLSAYEEAFLQDPSVGTLTEWLESLKGEGRLIELQKGATAIQWRYVGDIPWIDLVQLADLKGDKGDDGPAIQMQATSTQIQWRVTGTTVWNNLIAVADLKGGKGDTGASLVNKGAWAAKTYNPGEYVFSTSSTSSNNSLWFLLDIAPYASTAMPKDDVTHWQELAVPPGVPGASVELQKSATAIQWRQVGSADWTDLVLLADLKGADGTNPVGALLAANFFSEMAGFNGTQKKTATDNINAMSGYPVAVVNTVTSFADDIITSKHQVLSISQAMSDHPTTPATADPGILLNFRRAFNAGAALIQVFSGNSGVVYWRVGTGGPGAWTWKGAAGSTLNAGWRVMFDNANLPTALQVGAQPSSTTALGTTNIATLNQALRGNYIQTSTVNASVANGYPAGATAGTLEVLAGAGTLGAMQRYTNYLTGQSWFRATSAAWNGVDGPWTAWVNANAVASVNSPAISLDNVQDLNFLGFADGSAATAMYYQSRNAYALTTLNYPEAKSGLLIVSGGGNGCMQTYISYDTGQIYVRGLNAAWSATSPQWKAWSRAVAFNSMNVNVGTIAAATDLNTLGFALTTAINVQNYYQSIAAQATLALNYPEAAGIGSLTVYPNPYGCLQVYTTMAGNVWTRSLTAAWNGSGPWGPWVRSGGVPATLPEATTGTDPNKQITALILRQLMDSYGLASTFLNVTANLNTAVLNSNFTWSNTTTNIPLAGTYGRGFTLASDGNNITQFGIVNGSGAAFVRFSAAGVWSAWTAFSPTLATSQEGKEAIRADVAATPAGVREFMEQYGITATFNNAATDLNLVLRGEFFSWSSTTLNIPVASSYGRGFCIASDAQNITQFAIVNGTGAIWMRFSVTVTGAISWGAWTALNTGSAALAFARQSGSGNDTYAAGQYLDLLQYSPNEANGITVTSASGVNTFTVAAAGLYQFELEIRIDGGATGMLPVGAAIGISIDTTTKPTVLRPGYSVADTVSAVTILRLVCVERLTAGAARRPYFWNGGAVITKLTNSMIKITRLGA